MRLVVLAVLALPAIATAQPGPDDLTPPGQTPPIVAPPAPAPPLTLLDLAQQRDAGADRAFASSTGLVVPRGTADVSIRFGPGYLDTSAAVGLGSGVELSADYARGGNTSMAGAALKIAVVRERWFGLAIEGSYHSTTNEDSENQDGSVWSASVAASVCTDDSCTVLLSATGGMVSDGGAAAAYGTASLLVGTGGFRPMVEVVTTLGGGGGFLGVRMGGHNAAVDVGFVVAGGDDDDGGAILPAFGLTIRP